MPRVAALLRAVLVPTVGSLTIGCAVGPNYTRPQLVNPAQYRFVDGTVEAQSLADSPWWQVFDDPALQALVREALANNLDLQLAVARVEEARARAGVAKSYLYPQVDGGANYNVRGASNTETQNGTPTDDGTHQSGSYGFQLSWEIDLFGKLRRQHEASLALLLASDQGRRGVLVTLVGDVATNYFLLRELDLQLEISRQTLRLNDETVTYFQNRLDGASRTGSSSIAFRPCGPRPPPRSRQSSNRLPSSRTCCRCCLAVRRLPSRAIVFLTARPCRRPFRPDCRPR